MYWVVTLGVIGWGIEQALRLPVAPGGAPVQRLLYLHLPAAVNTLLAALVAAIAGVAYLGGRRQIWDLVVHAAAAVTVLNGTVLLLTGMFWAKVSWAHWWVWSPRLTFSLILWVLYSVYFVFRARIVHADRRAVISAVYAVAAFLDVPLLYLSVKLLPDRHPPVSGLSPEMYPVLWTWLIGLAMLSGGILLLRLRLSMLLLGDPAAGTPECHLTKGGRG